MQEEIDTARVAGIAIAEIVKEFSAKTTEFLTNPVKRLWAKATMDFESHLSHSYQKNMFVRILSNKAVPLKLSDIYVSGTFICEEEIISDNDLIQIIRDGGKVILKGDGGLGKTFFVKKLWASIFEHPYGKVPVFLSLRELNELSKMEIETFIRSTLLPRVTNSVEVFDGLCKSGNLIFIFDGFDEVLEEHREPLKRQLIELSYKAPNCSFLISSRHTDKFHAWDSFFEYSVVRFKRDQALQLFENIPFDEKTKKKFVKTITPAYFKEHESFLSNPLLAIMMLVTFSDNANIPTKRSSFYEMAFQTLYALHDGLKDGVYSRERELEKESFRRVFALFCLFSYYKQDTTFTENELLEYLDKAKKYSGIDATNSKIIKEFVESTNLLQLEGLKYQFIHRSFQEYFAAYCATKNITNKNREFLETFFHREYDQTFKLAYEIHPDMVEEEIVLPKGVSFLEEGKLPKVKSSTKFPYFFLWASNALVELNPILERKTLSANMFISTVDASNTDMLKFIRTISDLYGSAHLVSEFTQMSRRLFDCCEKITDRVIELYSNKISLTEEIDQKYLSGPSNNLINLSMKFIFEQESYKLKLDFMDLECPPNFAEDLNNLSGFFRELDESIKVMSKKTREVIDDIKLRKDKRLVSLEDLIDFEP